MSWSIDIISCITDRFVELTATEKRIAQFILDDVAAAAELPIAEIARLTQTSQASVTRFARALGCKDVRELKMKLAQSLAVGQRFILDVPDLEGVQGIYESIISVLETNRRALDIEALKRAVSWLSDARQILALGMGGGSTICAQEIQYRLFRLGLPVVSQSDGLLVRMMSSAVTPQDVVIVLSLGGYTREIIESAAIASQYGAKVIAITPAGTPLAEQADLVLPLLVRENDYIFKPSTSRYAMLAMVRQFGERAMIGAGTVLKVEQVDFLAEAGAKLIVTPNTAPAVIRRAVDKGMLVCAGCATASEAFSALDAGAQWLKIFPSSAFGADYIRALKAVLPPEVPVLAVGGVTPESLATWIQAGCAGAGLGSDLYRAGQAVERTREQAERFISASKS